MKLLLLYTNGCDGFSLSKISRHLKELGISPGRGCPQEGCEVWAFSISNEDAEVLHKSTPEVLDVTHIAKLVPYTN
jgi:hypothetical protein